MDETPLTSGRRHASRSSLTWPVLTVLLAAAAFSLKMWLALTTYGTDDPSSWYSFVDTYRTFGEARLYTMNPGFIHPPFMINLVKLLDVLPASTGLPLEFWFRLPGILADVGSTALVWKILRPLAGARWHPLLVVLYAAAPASLMISGFHGNSVDGDVVELGLVADEEHLAFLEHADPDVERELLEDREIEVDLGQVVESLPRAVGVGGGVLREDEAHVEVGARARVPPLARLPNSRTARTSGSASARTTTRATAGDVAGFMRA
jgi:hypothetical protein